jgi:hypothetical protein
MLLQSWMTEVEATPRKLKGEVLNLILAAFYKTVKK